MNYSDEFIDHALTQLQQNQRILAQERRQLIVNAHEPNMRTYRSPIDRFTPGGEFRGRFQYLKTDDGRRTIDVVRTKTFAWWVNRHLGLYCAAFLLSILVLGSCALALVPWRWPTEADVAEVIIGVVAGLAFLHATRERKE